MSTINRAVSFGMGVAVLVSSFSSFAAPSSASDLLSSHKLSSHESSSHKSSSHNLVRPTTPPPMPTELPGLVERRIKLDLAKRVNVPISRLNIYAVNAADWHDDCLELAYLDETCQQQSLKGWKVWIREDGTNNNWNYRTDRTGRRLRLDLTAQLAHNTPLAHSDFSIALSQKLLHKASEQLQQPINNLSIGDIQTVTWEDGCLGISEADTLCTQATMPGFRAVVINESQKWVYHLSADGAQMVRNTAASDAEGNTTIFFTDKQVIIDSLFNETFNLESPIIFQGQYRSWLDDSIMTTALSADGKVSRIQVQAALNPDSEVPTWEYVPIWEHQHQISSEAVAAFQTLLEQNRFSNFDQIGYVTEQDVAFEGSYVVTSAGTSVELSYWEANELPENLQPIMEAWEKIAR